MVDSVSSDGGQHPRALVLRLPGLVAGRDLADQMLTKLSTSYAGAQVVVDASQTSSGSASFASQTVLRVLGEGGAVSLTVVGAPTRFADQFRQAAGRLQVEARLHLAPSMRAGAVREIVAASP